MTGSNNEDGTLTIIDDDSLNFDLRSINFHLHQSLSAISSLVVVRFRRFCACVGLCLGEGIGLGIDSMSKKEEREENGFDLATSGGLIQPAFGVGLIRAPVFGSVGMSGFEIESDDLWYGGDDGDELKVVVLDDDDDDGG
ncbi:hypothetical protein Ddye_000830 [Dipteronia dyeriana]|uniref:Uncharacterized protein n=1 Tax=Dipteronia dyeriana TaxID=168575 RepID=A0AAD9XMX8_9ROSI|nr:hypothetical protein Ddye_000830 [Dipteronia dyeriana]